MTRSLACLILTLAYGGAAPNDTELPTASLPDQFIAANRLYEQGLYQEATAAYTTILDTGHTSEAVHFNLGNAYFRSGQLGKAIAQYRLAQVLAPRDPDILANLRFARQQVPGTASVAVRPWLRRLNRLSLDEWTLLTAVALWLTCGLLALAQWRPNVRRRLRPWLLATLLTTLLLVIGTLSVWLPQHLSPLAVVLTPETALRYGPLEESQVHFTVHEGTELSVEDVQNEWVQLSDAAQRTGWARRDALWLPEAAESN